MGDKYRPSNGTEGMGFIGCFCDNCLHEHPDPDGKPKCDILSATFVYEVEDKEYPEEWTYNDKGQPTCTKFTKWDWGKDDNGNWIMPEPPPIDDPNQLCLPFIFDEIGIKEVKPVEA